MLRNSACEGWVVHRRGEPRHQFRYRVWMLLADTAELAREGSALLGRRRRFSVLQLRTTDYLNVDGDVLRGVNAYLQQHGLPACDRVFVLSQPRSWGVFFNPVNFYFCFSGDALCYVLPEINNTPWDEKHVYLLDVRDQRQRDELRCSFRKTFHVSPFLPMDLDYQWRIRLQDDAIHIAIRLLKDDHELLFAGLYLSARAIGAGALNRGRYRYAMQNLLTLARIYWQAGKLYSKRSTFHAHPRQSNEVTST